MTKPPPTAAAPPAATFSLPPATVAAQPLAVLKWSPQVNFFQLFVQGDHEELAERHLDLAEETGTFLFYRLKPSEVPGVAVTEIHCWENAMRFDLAALRPFLDRWLA